MIVEGLQPVLDDVQHTNPRDAEDARRCLPYIMCFCCLDTKRYIGDHIYNSYQIRSCSCNGLIQDYESTNNLNQSYQNRPLHYIGNNGTSAIKTAYDVVRILADIYRRDYQPIEDEAERKRNEECKKEERLIAETKSEKELYDHIQWEEITRKDFNQEIRDTNISIDLQKLANDIASTIKLYTGNFIILSELVNKLDLKLCDFKSYKNIQESHIMIKYDINGNAFFIKFVYILLEYELIEQCCFIKSYRSIKKINSQLILMRPKDENIEVIELGRRLMTKDMGLL